MKKTYTKLETEVLVVENDEGFMQCSVRVNAIEVEPYHEYNFGTIDNPQNSFEIGFGE